MGSQAILDILSSMIIFGSFLLIMINLQMDNYEYSVEYANQLIVQKNLVSLSRIIKNDIQKIGYRDPWVATGKDDSEPPVYANLNEYYEDYIGISCQTGVIYYWLGGYDNTTENPRDKKLIRLQTPFGDEEKVGTVTKFALRYFAEDNTELISPDWSQRLLISSVEMYIQMETPYPVENYNAVGLGKYVLVDNDTIRKYSAVEWKYRFATQTIPPKER